MSETESVDLLRLEMETLWGEDLYGRPRRSAPSWAIGLADDGQEVQLGDLLAPSEDGIVHEGPSYVFSPEGFASPIDPPSLLVFTSASEAPPILATSRPEVWGDAEEWTDLLAGRLGPWAIGVERSLARTVAICYTPVASFRAAEAGVWTLPEARGRGYGTSVTAAWAKSARDRFEVLFYSTGADNAASQGIARKLGLRPIGRIRQIAT